MPHLRKGFLLDVLRKSELLIGLLVAVALISLALFAITIFVTHSLANDPNAVNGDFVLITQLLDVIMLIFIIAELLKMAIAYLQEEKVLDAVFEATIVAVARKIVISGTAPLALDKAASLAAIMIAVGITWHLWKRAERSPTLPKSRELRDLSPKPSKLSTG